MTRDLIAKVQLRHYIHGAKFLVVQAATPLRCLLHLSYIRAVWLELAATWSLLVLAQARRDLLDMALA
jgi:hypothetical protein